MKKNKKLQLNKITVAELTKDEMASIYGGVANTVTCAQNTACKPEGGLRTNPGCYLNIQQTLDTDCNVSYIYANCATEGAATCNKAKTCNWTCEPL